MTKEPNILYPIHGVRVAPNYIISFYKFHSAYFSDW